MHSGNQCEKKILKHSFQSGHVTSLIVTLQWHIKQVIKQKKKNDTILVLTAFMTCDYLNTITVATATTNSVFTKMTTIKNVSSKKKKKN